jgi:hypothetical protein
MNRDPKLLESTGWTFLRTRPAAPGSSTVVNLWQKPGYGVLTQWRAL